MKTTSHHLRPWIAAAIALFTFDTVRQLPAASAILTGDTYTDANKPNNNFGNAVTLQVAGSGATLKRAWIKFDLPSVLPAGTTAAQISKATLKLWVTTVGTAGPVSVYVVTGPSWVEGTGAAGSGMTNGTAPAVAATALFTGWQMTSAGNYAALDLTSLVQSWVAGSAPNYGIALVPGASTVNVSFDSKESTTTSHGPQLEIELVNQGPAGPIGPQGPQGLTGATGAVGPIGPQGLQGLTGAAGAVGPIGPQGLQGLTGATGAGGPSGPQGLQGLTGAAGEVGPIGPQGPQGLAGATGAIGPKGLNWTGAWSDTTAYAVNDAVAIDGAAYVALVANTNVAPPSAATWSLLAQKGETGATGAQGPQGLAGAIGPMGPQGPQGFIGPMGLMGPMGFPGVQGAVGPMGPVGPQGPQGDSFWQGQGNLIYFETGSLGLGTTTPAYRLDVVGDSRITGNLILTGNGSKIIMPVQGDISMGEFTAQ